MIIDCFTFFDELDLLEIRLNELKDVVDVFVLTESPYTFTGIEKPLHFDNNRKRFKKFNIAAVAYEPYITAFSPADYEAKQKQFNLDFAYYNIFSDGDIIIQGDCDEIPSAESIINALDDDWKSARFVMTMFYYWLNCREVGQGYKNRKYKNSRLIRPDKRIVYNAKQNDKVDKTYHDGWHFSFLGDIKSKLAAWGHANEYNKPPYNTPEHIKKCREQGLDLMKRNMKFEFVDDLNYLPKYVLENLEKFQKYIWTPQ